MDEKKIFSYVSFAIKAGQVVYGIDNLKITKNHIYCVILSKTASQNLMDNVLRFCEKHNIPFVCTVTHTIDELAHTKNCKVLGITNPNIAKQIIYLKTSKE